MYMPLLAFVRHGQSQWNLENRFTGETDVDLTPLGREEAKRAGQKLKPYRFDQGFTSLLKRAQETLEIVLREMGQTDLLVTEDHALNERNYGKLQGLNKAETAKEYGEEQVAIWRRSYDVQPPGGESLKDTVARVLPYYHEHIEPLLKEGKHVLIVAHGNSLRGLMMFLEDISVQDIPHVDIPTGVPRLYEFDEALKVLKVGYL